MKILWWISTKPVFGPACRRSAYKDQFSDNFYDKYFPQIFYLRHRLEKIISVPNFYWNNYPHLVVYEHLISTIELIENLCGLRPIFFKDTPLTDLDKENWNSVFKDFWNYKHVSRYKEQKKIHSEFILSTPIDKTKLENAIMCMVENFEHEISIVQKVNTNISFDNIFEIKSALYRVDNFYIPYNYKKFVNLDILYNKERAICREYDYSNYVHLDNRVIIKSGFYNISLFSNILPWLQKNWSKIIIILFTGLTTRFVINEYLDNVIVNYIVSTILYFNLGFYIFFFDAIYININGLKDISWKDFTLKEIIRFIILCCNDKDDNKLLIAQDSEGVPPKTSDYDRREKVTVMGMNNNQGGNQSGQQQGGGQDNPEANPMDNPQVNPPANQNISGISGFRFEVTTNRYMITDPNGTTTRGFNPNGGNQPYASYLANALQHIYDTNDHKQLSSHLYPQDLQFWNNFCSNYNSNTPGGQAHRWNSLPKIRAIRRLP